MANVLVNISSAVVEVGSSAYRTDKIDAVKSVGIKASALELMTRGRSYAVLIRFAGDYIVLVQSRDKDTIIEVANKITRAMSEHAKGNPTYFSSVNLNGDIVNQSGNFGAGFNKGEISL
jgi:hypothetical protein